MTHGYVAVPVVRLTARGGRPVHNSKRSFQRLGPPNPAGILHLTTRRWSRLYCRVPAGSAAAGLPRTDRSPQSRPSVSRSSLHPRPPRPAGGPSLRERALFDQTVADRPQEAPQLFSPASTSRDPARLMSVPICRRNSLPALPARGGLVVAVVGGEQRRRPFRPRATSLGGGTPPRLRFAGSRRRTRSGARGRPRPRGPLTQRVGLVTQTGHRVELLSDQRLTRVRPEAWERAGRGGWGSPAPSRPSVTTSRKPMSTGTASRTRPRLPRIRARRPPSG